MSKASRLSGKSDLITQLAADVGYALAPTRKAKAKKKKNKPLSTSSPVMNARDSSRSLVAAPATVGFISRGPSIGADRSFSVPFTAYQCFLEANSGTDVTYLSDGTNYTSPQGNNSNSGQVNSPITLTTGYLNTVASPIAGYGSNHCSAVQVFPSNLLNLKNSFVKWRLKQLIIEWQPTIGGGTSNGGQVAICVYSDPSNINGGIVTNSVVLSGTNYGTVASSLRSIRTPVWQSTSGDMTHLLDGYTKRDGPAWKDTDIQVTAGNYTNSIPATTQTAMEAELRSHGVGQIQVGTINVSSTTNNNKIGLIVLRGIIEFKQLGNSNTF